MTTPVLISYIPPMIFISLLFSISANTWLAERMLSIVIITFFSATSFTKSLFFEFLKDSSLGFVTASTAGSILFIRAVRFPSRAWSQAPLTAPHAVWPKTTISLVPASLQANSILPKISSLTKLPAIRMLNKSPMPWSKISSDDTLESIQLKTVANGY